VPINVTRADDGAVGPEEHPDTTPHSMSIMARDRPRCIPARSSNIRSTPRRPDHEYESQSIHTNGGRCGNAATESWLGADRLRRQHFDDHLRHGSSVAHPRRPVVPARRTGEPRNHLGALRPGGHIGQPAMRTSHRETHGPGSGCHASGSGNGRAVARATAMAPTVAAQAGGTARFPGRQN